MYRKIITLLLLMFCLGNILAQDMLGTWGSNYGGVASTFQNPAFIANSKLYADINLVGINLSYYHSDSYLEESDTYIYNFLHNTLPLPKTDKKINYYAKNRPDFVKAYISARELGPGFMLNSGRNAFAVSFSVREFASLTQIPDAFAKLTKLGYADSAIIVHGNYNINQPIRAAAMAWAETDFTYARILKSDDQDVVTVGATLKYLLGIGGGYLYVDNVDFGMKDRSTFTINNSNVDLGFSLPYDYGTNQGQLSVDRKFKLGKGFGTDLGITIQHNSRLHYIQRFSRYCEQEFEQYDYRFAISLLDVGYIAFKDHAVSGRYANTKPIEYNLRNFVFNSTKSAIDSLNSIYKVKDTSNIKKKFSVLLPTALSFQYDKRITDHLYVTAGGIIGMPMGKKAIQRPSQLAIIPRYESDIFEFSLPLSLYDFSKPRLGFSTRIFFLTLGTDRLLSLGGVHDYFGYDFYATIRLNFMKIFRMQFVKGECHESASHPCY